MTWSVRARAMAGAALVATAACGPIGEAVGRQLVIDLLARSIVPTSDGVDIRCGDVPGAAPEPRAEAAAPAASAARFRVARVSDGRSDQRSIGEMFTWDGPNRLVLREGAGLDTVLRADAVRILRLHGATVEAAPDAGGDGAVPLHLHVTRAWVRSSPAGWTEARGTIRADFEFRVLVGRPQPRGGLDLVFVGENVSRAAVLSKAAHEAALSAAYCQSLNTFSRSVKDGLHRLQQN